MGRRVRSGAIEINAARFRQNGAKAKAKTRWPGRQRLTNVAPDRAGQGYNDRQGYTRDR
jgi:hypothetical protein